MPPTPFTIDIDRSVLDDLRARLDRTRWANDLGDPGWKYGASIPYMRELTAYWRDGFDWRAQERALNAFANFRVTLKNVSQNAHAMIAAHDSQMRTFLRTRQLPPSARSRMT
jgi:hypothetical protein